MNTDKTTCRSLLILGGARSGKSRLAQRLAEESGLDLLLLATAEASDQEMAERIARHRAERGPAWQTVEESLAVPERLATEARPDRILVLDCATLWLSNCLLAGKDLDLAGEALAASIAAAAGPVIVVSNEVGLSLVPEFPLGRQFRDAQGHLNQLLAATCERVVFVAAGLPIVLKPRPKLDISFG